ncbi:MAG: hypothetical protein NT142_16695, partial [Planctomycetota bacterium]|nr:hypothetical protein [Planctomycetota bacterium]
WLHVVQAITWQAPFFLLDQPSLLTHRKNTDYTEWENLNRGKANRFLPRKRGDLSSLLSYFFRVFSVFPWLIIKISIIGLTQHARQLPCALFVRRLRFRLVKNRNRNGIFVYFVPSVAIH